MTAAISLSGVTKRFGKFTAVDRLDLEIPVGVTFGLLGPNGAGKTTTIRMTMNITKADEGTVRILGRTLDEEGQQRIGYLPEERGLYRKMTVLDQLLFFAAIKGVERKTALERLERWIDVMDLRPWLKKKTEELSKGMQQKVQFLGTIVHDPEVLILDEPFSGLDPINVVLLKDFLLDFKRQGKTIVFSTHVMEQAEKLCDRIALIYRGRKLLDGTVKQVKDSYRDRVPLPPPVEPEPELEKIFIKAVEESGLAAPTSEELR
ncbi:MAG TPA: ATP-binding cassette domain-containing protein [Thermoanaerobaculia bacterium]|nr:ATP-binding cassette domain-containing protein [Thermoanaerobaculia bacterium]HQP89219.1 ATP-binding cassette domain-containing protein [Thermoanaerobaculia bacterium]